jgi:hypothetical protein
LRNRLEFLRCPRFKGIFGMRVLTLLLVLPLLAACSADDWNYLTSFGASKPAEAEVAAAPATVPAASAPPAANAFCVGVAKQDATSNGFDTATQQRVAVNSYRQCVAVFGDGTGN